jgi:hypothetical protein
LDFESVLEEGVSDEVVLKLVTARRSYLNNELLVYLFYSMDDPIVAEDDSML